MFKKALLILVSAGSVCSIGCTGGPETPPANYTAKIPGTDIEFEMIYVPGGEFIMGSPENEPGREPDEGPQRRVRVKPFWIGKTEVTWEMYEQYAFAEDSTMLDAVTLASPKLSLSWMRNGWKWLRQRAKIAFNENLDAITRPTPYYDDFYHGMGRGKKPVIAVNWPGALAFCEYLSKKTGHHYRLPTEAEWEFACRAGSSSMYSFGDDVEKLGEYAWFEENSDWETHEVGLKKPNAFGIHDMHGNVWEFCVDYYDPDYFLKLKESGVNIDPRVKRGVKPTVRGGSWDDPASQLRSANRMAQLDWWNERDPQRPRGKWWLVDGEVVGFRIVRPVEE